jgi:hypothetical protein
MRILKLSSIFLLGLVIAGICFAQDLARERVIGAIELVATFNGAMPTGVTVANDGRIFLNFPRWGDDVEYTVAELRDGKTFAYPDAKINQYAEGDNAAEKLVSVQGVVVDPSGDRLWILDTGSIQMGPTKPGGPKLIAVDLKSNQIVKKIIFPANVALSTTYLNDVRFDLHRGSQGMAFITDSSSTGANGIIVVDLGSGDSCPPSLPWDRMGLRSVRTEKLFITVRCRAVISIALAWMHWWTAQFLMRKWRRRCVISARKAEPATDWKRICKVAFI